MAFCIRTSKSVDRIFFVYLRIKLFILEIYSLSIQFSIWKVSYAIEVSFLSSSLWCLSVENYIIQCGTAHEWYLNKRMHSERPENEMDRYRLHWGEKGNRSTGRHVKTNCWIHKLISVIEALNENQNKHTKQ